jgi:hypothetical protein
MLLDLFGVLEVDATAVRHRQEFAAEVLRRVTT